MAVKKTKSTNYRRVRFYIVAAVVGAIASGVSLVAFSLLVFLLGIPVAQSGFFSIMAFGIGCLVAGFTAGAKKRQGGLSTGIKAALLFCVPVILIGLVLNGFAFAATGAAVAEGAVQTAGSSAIGVGTFGKVTLAVLCGSVGGVLGVNRNGGF
ncbi:MAG: YrzE family protein [Oscillospiraceae bacterium]|nr:YrzE family protein [Oscillospiraceae bacterium]